MNPGTRLQAFAVSLTKAARSFYWLAGIESVDYSRIGRQPIAASNDSGPSAA